MDLGKILESSCLLNVGSKKQVCEFPTVHDNEDAYFSGYERRLSEGNSKCA
jgi:hypothetical protein